MYGLLSFESLHKPSQSNSGRLTEIDRAKGLAILLVVIGHLIVGTHKPEGNAWFEQLVTIIYSFHMPFFMYLSGFVMLYTFKPLESKRDYFDYSLGKFKRLAPGFFCFALIILLGKILVSQFLHVDNQPAELIQGVVDIVLTPGLSAAKGLWFIYVLFEFYLLAPLILFVFGGRPIGLVIVGLVVYFLPSTPLFMLDGAFEYLVYFGIGATIAHHFSRVQTWLDKYSVQLFIVFTLSLFLLEYSPLAYPVTKLIIGCLSIPAIHALIRMAPFSNSNLFLGWGLVSYAIYLMNTIAIGFTKGVLLQFVSWDGTNFLFVAPILLAAGFYGPILVKRYVLPYVRPLDRITS